MREYFDFEIAQEDFNLDISVSRIRENRNVYFNQIFMLLKRRTKVSELHKECVVLIITYQKVSTLNCEEAVAFGHHAK